MFATYTKQILAAAGLTSYTSVMTGGRENPPRRGDETYVGCAEAREHSDAILTCPPGTVILSIRHAISHPDVTCDSPYVTKIDVDCLPVYTRQYIHSRAVGQNSYKFNTAKVCLGGDANDKCWGKQKNNVVEFVCGVPTKFQIRRHFRWTDGTAFNFDTSDSKGWVANEPNNYDFRAILDVSAKPDDIQTVCNTYARILPNKWGDDPTEVYFGREDCIALRWYSVDIYGLNDTPCSENIPETLKLYGKKVGKDDRSECWLSEMPRRRLPVCLS